MVTVPRTVTIPRMVINSTDQTRAPQLLFRNCTSFNYDASPKFIDKFYLRFSLAQLSPTFFLLCISQFYTYLLQARGHGRLVTEHENHIVCMFCSKSHLTTCDIPGKHEGHLTSLHASVSHAWSGGKDSKLKSTCLTWLTNWTNWIDYLLVQSFTVENIKFLKIS